MTAAASIGKAALDPGRSKCGLVLADASGQQVVAAAILPPRASLELLLRWHDRGLQHVVLGNGTGSEAWYRQLSKAGLSVDLMDERGTTLAARQRYWLLEEERSWRRWLPRGLRLPPRDIDDVAAQLLLERHLGHCLVRQALPVWRQLPPAL